MSISFVNTPHKEWFDELRKKYSAEDWDQLLLLIMKVARRWNCVMTEEPINDMRLLVESETMILFILEAGPSGGFHWDGSEWTSHT